jgi:formyltetrahydrofolate deformylase
VPAPEDSEHPVFSNEADGPGYTGRLLISCADRSGIVAAVSGFLFERGANIVSSHQYSSDPSGGRFFMRTEFVLEEPHGAQPRGGSSRGGEGLRIHLPTEFGAEVAPRFEMAWRIRWWDQRPRVAILASRHDHCVFDLLWRWRRGELDGEIVTVISNHRDLEGETIAVGVPFHHVPIDAERKERAEAAMLALLTDKADVLVLARYMQILSGQFLHRVGMPAINIHHSFLPAFAGAKPYRRAHERGVKLIGATAHYVTEQLDDGPIIEQDVVRVDDRQSVEELERVGRDVERLVLARALALHLADRVIVDGARTVVF